MRQLVTATMFVIAACCLGQEPEADAAATANVKVSLSDGSQLQGTLRASSLALGTAFGKQEIPFAQIAALDFAQDGVKVMFRNKDVLSGKFEGTTFDLQTVFDDVRLEPSQIKSITFSRQRDLSLSANEPGLLLHAPLDTEEPELDLFGARMDTQKVRTTEGPSGTAISLDAPDAKATIHRPFSPHALPEGTIEFWARLPQPRQRLSGGGQPWFFSIEEPDRNKRHFVFGFTANDGSGKGGLVGRTQGIALAGTHYAGTISNIAETGLLRETPGEWHHYAIIWKLDGVDFPDARGNSLVLTVDGRIVAVADRIPNETVQQTAAEGFRLIIRDGNTNSARPLAMSDLKIWNYAKLPDEL